MDLIDQVLGETRSVVSDFFDTLPVEEVDGSASDRDTDNHGTGPGSQESSRNQSKRFQGLPVRVAESDLSCTGFSGHRTLHTFFLNSSGDVETSRAPPVLDPESLCAHAGRNIHQNWQHNVVIDEYVGYSSQKGKYFHETLKNDEKFEWIWKTDEPVFAASAGVFTLCMFRVASRGDSSQNHVHILRSFFLLQS